jgi:hypothetical protein
MEIKVIKSIDQFNKLKQNWNDIHAEDPHATIFPSWTWMRGWIEATMYNWQVLAVRPTSTKPYVGFMVLGISSVGNFRFNIVHGNLHMGGNPISDCTGFVCLPDYIDVAIPAFAKFIQKQLKWNTFSLMNVFDPRLDLFLQYFSPKRFHVQELEETSCPYISLPNTWDQYLNGFLSPNTRKNLKYYTTKVEQLKGYQVIHVHTDNLETQIDTLLKFWQKRWGLPSEQIYRHRALYQRCFEENALWLTTLWAEKTPIAGVAGIIDQKLKTFILYTPVFNDTFAKYSPGKVMVGYSIRYAIENGFQVYDFGAGDERYKFSFGVKERFNRNIIISSNTLLVNLKKRMPETLKTFGKRLLSTSKKI